MTLSLLTIERRAQRVLETIQALREPKLRPLEDLVGQHLALFRAEVRAAHACAHRLTAAKKEHRAAERRLRELCIGVRAVAGLRGVAASLPHELLSPQALPPREWALVVCDWLPALGGAGGALGKLLDEAVAAADVARHALADAEHRKRDAPAALGRAVARLRAVLGWAERALREAAPMRPELDLLTAGAPRRTVPRPLLRLVQ